MIEYSLVLEGAKASTNLSRVVRTVKANGSLSICPGTGSVEWEVLK